MMGSNLKTTRNDMKNMLQDAQDLFREATSSTGAKADELRNRGISLLDEAMDKAHEAQVAAVETGREMVDTADDYVQENPWQAVAMAAGIGLLAGMLIGRGSR